MFDAIDPRSPTPLYDQIAARIRVAVAAGELAPGQALPSVRQLAARLRVNPATVVQAYRQLASEGFVETRHGAGTFIREVDTSRRTRERASHATRLVRSLLAEAARLGLDTSDIVDAVEREVGTGAV